MTVLYMWKDWCQEGADAARRHAPGAIFVQTAGVYDYNVVMEHYWGLGEDLIIVEADKVMHYGVMPSFRECRRPWCVFAYPTYPAPYTRPITIGLGCTRFTAEIQDAIPASEFLVADHPDWGLCPDCNGAGCWRFLDSRIGQCLWSRGHESHVHGWVNHLHDYPPEWGEVVGPALDGGGRVWVTDVSIRRRSAMA